MGPLREQYAVYVNGQEIAKVGQFDSFSSANLAQTRTFPIPAATLNGGRMVIAIRVGGEATTPPQWEIAERAPWLLTYRTNAPAARGSESLAPQRSRLTPTLMMSVIFLIFGIQVLFDWLE